MALRLAVTPLRAPLPWARALRAAPLVHVPALRTLSTASKFTAFQYHKGAIQVTLPVPRDDLDDWVTFSSLPGETVEMFLDRMRSEDSCFEGVTMRHSDGTPADPSELLVTVVDSQVNLSYSGISYDVYPAQYSGGAYGLMDEEGDLSLRTIMQKGAFAAVRRELESIEAHSISYRDYIERCAAHGVPAAEAQQLLHDLHRVGFVLHFHESSDPKIRDQVFLHPAEVVDAVFAEFGLRGPNASYIEEQRAIKEAEVAEMEDMLKLKKMQVEAIESRAKSWATAGNWVGFASIVGGGAYYAYLAFVELSWDIMEPVTYFTATGLSIVGYFWWLATSSEFEYESMHQTLHTWRKEALSRSALDARDLDAEALGSRLRSEGASKRASDALQSELEELEADLIRAKDQMEILDVGNYHPALLSVYLNDSHAPAVHE